MEEPINMSEQVLLICIGAFISIITSIINKLVDNIANRKGQVLIYRKLVYQKYSSNISTGIYDRSNETVLVVPIWIEIQNTKKVPIIIRDFSLVLYKDGKRVKKMKQITHQKNGDSETEIYYGDNGRYSFLIQPESIMKYELLFTLKKRECNSDFDKIMVVYYDYNNKRVSKTLKDIENSWTTIQFDIDEDWIALN